jgi:UrcA family protein
MNKLVTLTAAALAAVSFTAPATAADAGRTVAYGDLDLGSPAGVEAFNRRIRAAAESVCGDAPGARSLAEAMWISRCVDATVADHRRVMQASAAAAIRA